MSTEIEFAALPGKRGAKLEDVLRRIRLIDPTGTPETDPEMEHLFDHWQSRWVEQREQVSRRLELLAEALEDQTATPSPQ
jgi:hypothetical protein